MNLDFKDIRSAVIGEGAVVAGRFGPRSLIGTRIMSDGSPLPCFDICLSEARTLADAAVTLPVASKPSFSVEEEALRWFWLPGEATHWDLRREVAG